MIVPPPVVRELVAKAAHAVARRPALERMLAQKHATNPRLAFLRPSDPYHAYYRAHVEALLATPAELPSSEPPAASAALESVPADAAQSAEPVATAPAAGGSDVAARVPSSSSSQPQPPPEAKPPPETQPLPQPQLNSSLPPPPPPPRRAPEGKTVVAPAVSKLNAAKLRSASERPPPVCAPAPDLFSVLDTSPPPGLLSLDVMKLAAQCCARDGRDFVALLAEKEGRNPLFDFLKPLHPHFALFQRLVDAYMAVLERRLAGDDEAPASLLRGSVVKAKVLANFWYRHDWHQLKSSDKGAGQGSAVPLEFSAGAIDWHDFVVLETVDLDETEMDLPVPLADPTQIPRVMAAADSMRLAQAWNKEDVDMDLDMDGAEAPDEHASRVELVVVTADVDADIPSGRVRKLPTAVPVQHHVKPPVVPAAAATVARDHHPQNVRLPDGQIVPMSDATPAMHAQLMDPKYKEERDRASAKNRRQNLADGEQVALHLARLKKSKPDSGVYNRGDLQASLVERTRGIPIERTPLPIPARSGPALPAAPVETDHPVRTEHVEAAVGALTSAANTKDAAFRGGLKPFSAGRNTLLAPVAASHANGLLSEADWLAKVGDKVAIVVSIPEHTNKDWVLAGQKIELEVPLRSTVLRLKEVLARSACTKVPANKQKLHFEGTGFLSNRNTLASYNIPAGATISLEVKERGGKKKAT